MQELYFGACPHCGEHHGTPCLHDLADDGEDDEMTELYRQLVAKVYAGELETGDIDVDTAVAQAKDFMKAVTEGYGQSLDEIDYDTPDYKMLANLQKSVYQFSGAKNYQELKLMTEALYDGDRLRTEAEHLAECQKIYADYNVRYHAAEYETAVGSAQMAARWQDFQQHADIMPLLKFVAIADERECPICRPYNGIIRPISDKFWSYAYPVLHFRCRCTVIQLADGKATTDGDVPGDETIPKMFRSNLAEKQIVFPEGHPYYKGVPKKLLKQFVKDNMPKRDA